MSTGSVVFCRANQGLVIPITRNPAEGVVVVFDCPDLNEVPIQRDQLKGSYNLLVSKDAEGANARITIRVQTRPELQVRIFLESSQCGEGGNCCKTARWQRLNEDITGVVAVDLSTGGSNFGTCNSDSDQLGIDWFLPNGIRYSLIIDTSQNGSYLNSIGAASIRVPREAIITGEANAITGDPFDMEEILEEDNNDEIQPGPLMNSSAVKNYRTKSKTPKKARKIRSCVKPNKRPAFSIKDCIKEIAPTPTVLNPDQEQVPNITIRAETIRDQMDVGFVTMIVRDTISYECIFFEPQKQKDPCKECPERIVNRSEVIETVFQRGINFNLVVEGEGCTLREKINFLKARFDIPVTATELFLRVVLYGALKYVLSRLLYGFFDARFLLRKYNKRFFQDLTNSRFCQFLNAFASPELRGIGCLFKWNLTKEDKKHRDPDQEFLYKDSKCKDCACKCGDNAVVRR